MPLEGKCVPVAHDGGVKCLTGTEQLGARLSSREREMSKVCPEGFPV